MIFVPHQILGLLEQKEGCWLKARSMEYQAILLDNPNVTLNPATLLSDSGGSLDLNIDCLEITDKVYSSWPDLVDQPLAAPDWEL